MAQLGTITIQAPTEPFLSSAEVGRVFSVSGKTIERWAETGTFPPPIVQGRTKVWSNLAVAAYILWCQVGPQQQQKATDKAAESPEGDE